ncbi:MAG: diacylglycerol kinase family protein [Verrucomicrobiota bacterium]
MSHCILLLNRASGGNQRGLDATEVCRTVEEIFREAGHEISSSLIDPGQIESALKRAITSKPDAIIVGGGDGTVSAAARLIGGTGIAMGVLPMGTFNLAARDLGVPLEIEDAARFLAAAEVFPIDVLDVSGHACLCTTILGFYPEFSNIFENRDHGGHWWKKTIKLLTGLRSTFMNARPLPLSWESDGGSGRARTKFSAFVPGRYQDTAGLIPARTDFQSGKLTAYISTHRKPASALRGIFDYTLGRHEQNPELQLVKTRRMTLRASRRTSCRTMLDGEILKLSFPIELRILPGHLKVLTQAEIITESAPEEK